MICLLETLSSQLGEEFTRDIHFAWKAFDFVARVYLKERLTFRPRSPADVSRIGSVHKKRCDLSKTLLPSSQQLQSMDDDFAATKIQATFRGYYVRKLNSAYRPGTYIRMCSFYSSPYLITYLTTLYLISHHLILHHITLWLTSLYFSIHPTPLHFLANST